MALLDRDAEERFQLRPRYSAAKKVVLGVVLQRANNTTHGPGRNILHWRFFIEAVVTARVRPLVRHVERLKRSVSIVDDSLTCFEQFFDGKKWQVEEVDPARRRLGQQLCVKISSNLHALAETEMQKAQSLVMGVHDSDCLLGGEGR